MCKILHILYLISNLKGGITMKNVMSILNEKYDNSHDQYPEFEQVLKNNFNAALERGKQLFTTDSQGLYEAYLRNLPAEARQHYTCNACRHFIEKFGGLVVILDDGSIESAMWGENDVPDFFSKSVDAMRSIVLKSKVNGVFISGQQILGLPVTGEWSHYSVTLPADMIRRLNGDRLKTADQIMAEKYEDFKMLKAAIIEYPLKIVNTALQLLQSEALYRSEKCLGVAQWFAELHVNLSKTKNKTKADNTIWKAVATAPVGFCHIRSSMIGTLLDDIAAGMSFDMVSRRFADKMHPLQYQRPQAAPSAGNIAQAEKIVEKLGIQYSLVRRFARVEEIEKIWMPKKYMEQPQANGVFSHLKPKDAPKELPEMELPTTIMTWVKFLEKVLPTAESIEYLVKSRSDNYAAILTAAYDDAPPIIQWDNEEKRNPFSWYLYHGGSYCSRWQLKPGYCNVTAIALQPSMWYEENEHHSKSVFFILEEAKDSGYKGAGNALFPNILKSELREIRSTIESYSKSAEIEGYEDASACGIRLQYGNDWDATFRVKTTTGIATYKLDRWD
jgi:hypothetical protein